MKKQVTNKLITEMKQMLGDKKSLTLESLVFDKLEEEYDMDNEYEEMPTEDFETEPQKQEMKCGVESEVKPMIDQIRKMALQGIAKLAEHPECETYTTLKKIWQMVDKSIESQNKNIVKEQ